LNLALALDRLKTAGNRGDIGVQILDQGDSGFGVRLAANVQIQRQFAGGPAIGFTQAPKSYVTIKSGRIESEEHDHKERIPYSPVLRPHFRSSEIASPSVTQSTPPQVSEHGAGLPSLLGYLKLRDDELFDRIEEHFCRVIPNVK